MTGLNDCQVNSNASKVAVGCQANRSCLAVVKWLMDLADDFVLKGIERLGPQTAVVSFVRQSNGEEVTIDVHRPRERDVLSNERAKTLAWETLGQWLEDRNT